MIYPEIDTLRRVSETFEKMPGDYHKQKNCNQLLMKGPALTRGFLDKFGPDGSKVLGYEIKTRRWWFLTGLVLLFCSSFIGTVIMWLTSMFDNAIYNQLVLANNTETYEMWKKPPPRALVSMYIFNYTNVEDYKNRIVDKLNVEEIGPYVYEEYLERVNIHFNDDDTISYQEKRDYKFRPELSQGHRQSDKVVVPNVPLLTGAAHSRHTTFLTRIAFSSLLKGLSEEAFLTLPVHNFLFGYDNDFYAISKNIMKLKNEKPTEEFGLFATKKGVSLDIITINTGASDINRVGMIEKINGEEKMKHWSTDECNSYGGTDGTAFPPKLIREKKQIAWYAKQMCRSIPMKFEREISILDGKVPAYRYKMPYNIFDTPDKEPHNQCFCDMSTGDCPVQGVFNTTPCVFGAPMFISLPHFFKGDPSLKEAITGLNPEPRRHESYADFHPTMGFLMSGTSRFQGNIKMVKSYGISELDIFQQDELLLPLTWLDVSLEDKNLPDEMVSIIYKTTFTIKGVELGLRYGCLLTSIVTAISIFIVLKARYESRERTSSIRPLQRREDSC